MRLILVFGVLALIATVFTAPSPKEDHHDVEVREAWSPDHGPFGVAKDGPGGVDGHAEEHGRSKRWGGWGWGRPWGMGWRRPWGMGWGRPWGMGMGMGYGGYGGYGWGR